MLYVFYVDLGKRLVLDMNLVNESVFRLKQAIEESQHICTNKQVLLISGGECLDDSVNVCRYSAGTDTNPIYLYNRTFLERNEKPPISADFRNTNVTDLDNLFESIERFDSRNASIYSINKINDLAQKYLIEALSITSYTNELNADALSQQQGLAAAIANLDDVMANFKFQCETFDSMYTRYVETRQENIDLMIGFSEDLKLLAQIPLLPALLEGNEEERARLELCYDKSKLGNISLLEWISTKDPEKSIEDVVEICRSFLEKYDEKALISLQQDIEKLFNEPEKLRALRSNSEISERLTNLSRLMVTIKQTFEDQEQKADGICLNLKRATDLKDDTILPDLVETHKNTLQSMKANHGNLRSCRQMCLQAKKDLCLIIHDRLKAVMIIQEQAAEIRSFLVLHGANMKRMRDYIELIQQLRTTPLNYFSAVSEVVRRRSYSQAFLMWASDLACRIFAIYSEETERRTKFLSQFEGHFLKCLFPGLDDMPPMFATQPPPLFDNTLPPLCEDDLKHLCLTVPNLEDHTTLPDVNAIRNFFLSKSLTLSEVDIQKNSEAKVASMVADQMCSLSDSIEDVKSPSSDKTEIFSLDMIISADGCSDTRANDTDTVANATQQMNYLPTVEKVTHRRDEEFQSMRDSVSVLGTITYKTVISLRRDLSMLRDWVYSNQSEIVGTVGTLYSELQKYRNAVRMLSEQLNVKDEKIRSMYCKISEIETERIARDENEELEKARFQDLVCETARKEKELAVKEVTEKLAHDHKKEMELQRQRLKLLTSANGEHLPSSDTNLERVERGEFISIGNHGAMMDQQRYTLKKQMESALAEERSKHAEEMRLLAEEKQKLVESVKTSLLEDFTRQLETMRQREGSLLIELRRHRDTIQTLTDPEGNSLLRRIGDLERDKNCLQAELIHERKHKYSFNAAAAAATAASPSGVVFNSSKESSGSTASLASNSSSSPELLQHRSRYKERVAYKKCRTSSSYLVPNKICLESCNVGDPVLVVWDDQKKNYTILQDSDTLHFVHPVSIDILGLRPASDGSPRKLYCPAEVTEKEYCASKRMKNRYNLEEGERFYRVKVKPLTNTINRLK